MIDKIKNDWGIVAKMSDGIYKWLSNYSKNDRATVARDEILKMSHEI
jgi:hypothetical protein